MTVRPFRMYSARESAALAKGLGEIVNAWYGKWFPRGSCHLEFRNVGGREDALVSRLRTARDGEGESLAICSDTVVILLSQPDLAVSHLLGSPGGGGAATAGAWSEVPDPLSAFDNELIRRMVVDCLESLGATLSATLAQAQTFTVLDVLPEDPGLQARFLRGKGAGVLEIVCDEFLVEAVLDAGLLAAYVQPLQVRKMGGLAPLMPLLGDKRVALRAELGATNLTIGDLDRLSVGDVVKLDQSIDTDPQLLTESGVPIVRGRLGSQGNHKALQIY